jgi:hypothetical protein
MGLSAGGEPAWWREHGVGLPGQLPSSSDPQSLHPPNEVSVLTLAGKGERLMGKNERVHE